MNKFDKDKISLAILDTKSLDLRFGNPNFMQLYWQDSEPLVSFHLKKVSNKMDSNCKMGYGFGFPSAFLKNRIRKLHSKVGNVVYDNRDIVVGAGASQLISAAVFALHRKYGLNQVFAESPHFPRFRHLTSFSGVPVEFVNERPKDNHIKIVTAPNNPDGALQLPVDTLTITDLCYNWPQYTPHMIKFDTDIAIFSLAKATGHASTRIGWAIVKDKEIAEHMTHYIEMSTCGVSIESMIKCQAILDSQIDTYSIKKDCFTYGSQVLKKRWNEIKQNVKDNNLEILNSSGMFLWGKVKSGTAVEYFKDKYDILIVGGSNFGTTDDSYFRINIGADIDAFLSLLRKLN